MNRNDLKVIVGGADRSVNPNRKFINAYVTDSRLMGVLVVCIRWSINGESLHQFFYIEVTESGIETYHSINGDSTLSLYDMEQSMLGGLGAMKVDISAREAYMLIQKYADLNDKYGEDLPEGYDEYGFILERRIKSTPAEDAALFSKTCVTPENDNQLISYFLMRLFAGDTEAVKFLCGGEIPEAAVPEYYCDTLCLNSIEDHNGSFVCESLIESGVDHRIIVSEIALADGAIASFDIISDFAISTAETAMKLERPEYVTVYDVLSDEDAVIDALDKEYPGALKRDTEVGRLYLNFNDNNNHLSSRIYRLNDDIKGMIYITYEQQLVVASYSLKLIRRMESEMLMQSFSRKLLPVGKYEFREDVFYDFAQSDYGDFLTFIREYYDVDPE